MDGSRWVQRSGVFLGWDWTAEPSRGSRLWRRCVWRGRGEVAVRQGGPQPVLHVPRLLRGLCHSPDTTPKGKPQTHSNTTLRPPVFPVLTPRVGADRGTLHEALREPEAYFRRMSWATSF